MMPIMEDSFIPTQRSASQHRVAGTVMNIDDDGDQPQHRDQPHNIEYQVQ